MKAAIITGASFGIGEATAKAMAEAGFNVVLTARSMDQLEALATEINSVNTDTTGKALAIKADVVNITDMKTVVEKTVATFGSADILVNNAGIMPLSFMKNLHVE